MIEFVWHVHHHTLMEPRTAPLAERIDYILKQKPVHEVDLRLRLLRPVQGVLPPAVVEAGEAWVKAEAVRKEALVLCNEAWRTLEGGKWPPSMALWEEYDMARLVYNAAQHVSTAAEQALVIAVKAHTPEIEALHAQECPNCPWNGETIFP